MDSKIVSKIQKLLALSTSSNQGEAMNALSRANALMKEYDISVSDIEDNKLNNAYGEIVDIDHGEITSQSKYKHLVFTSISQLFKVLVMRSILNTHRHRITWIGRKFRIEIAIHTYQYLIDSIDRITPKELKGSDRKNFQLGAARNICDRIKDMMVEDKVDSHAGHELTENTVDRPNQGSIVLATHEIEIHAYLAEKFPGVKKQAIGIKYGNQSGYDAANNISLNSHLSGSSSSKELTLSAQNN
jgi:Protein of unknown function (DUF2786)